MFTLKLLLCPRRSPPLPFSMAHYFLSLTFGWIIPTLIKLAHRGVCIQTNVLVIKLVSSSMVWCRSWIAYGLIWPERVWFRGSCLLLEYHACNLLCGHVRTCLICIFFWKVAVYQTFHKPSCSFVQLKQKWAGYQLQMVRDMLFRLVIKFWHKALFCCA